MGRGRTGDGDRPVKPGRAHASGSDPDAVEVHRPGDDHDERHRARGLGPDIPASGPTGAEERRMGYAGVAEGGTGQRITREDMRRAARDGVVDREEEPKGDGAYGSSTSDPILPAALAELVGTFILVFVVVSVATDSRAPAAIAPIAVGFALAVGVFIAGPVTGGALNPVRALGPMLVAGDLTSVWLYVLGPIVGGVLAAFLYERTMAQH
jgi:Major intrinsic protein